MHPPDVAVPSWEQCSIPPQSACWAGRVRPAGRLPSDAGLGKGSFGATSAVAKVNFGTMRTSNQKDLAAILLIPRCHEVSFPLLLIPPPLHMLILDEVLLIDDPGIARGQPQTLISSKWDFITRSVLLDQRIIMLPPMLRDDRLPI